MSVCLSVCVSVFLSVQVITFEPLHIETSFLTIYRSSLSINIIGSRSMSYEKKKIYLFQLVNPLYVVNNKVNY